MRWAASDVVDRIRSAYGLDISDLVQEEWALLVEVPLRSPRRGRTAESRIDVLLVRNWASGIGHQRVGIEVKVSRGDYRRETPAKRLPTEKSCHRTYYAAPAGLIDPDTLPSGWGLIEVYPTGDTVPAEDIGRLVGGGAAAVVIRRRATPRVPECDPDYLAAALARPGSRATEQIRRGHRDAGQVPALRAEVERLAGQVQRREATLARTLTLTRAALGELAAIEGAQTCADCGQPITMVRSGHSIGSWRHSDDTHEQGCYNARYEAHRVARETRHGARYLGGVPGPIEPAAARARLEQTQPATGPEGDAHG